MAQADEAAVLAFAQKLPVHDLLFLPRNISEPKVLSAWVKEIERGAITSLLAVQGGAGGRLRHAGARSAFVVAACRRNPHGGVVRTCAGRGSAGRCRRRPSRWRWAPGWKSWSVQMTVDQPAPSRCSRASASRPRRCCATMSGTSTASNARHRRARAQCGAGPGPDGSLRAAGGGPALGTARLPCILGSKSRRNRHQPYHEFVISHCSIDIAVAPLTMAYRDSPRAKPDGVSP